MKNTTMSELKFAYFGGEPLGVPVLEELKAAGLLPSLVVASPDRPSGRGHKLTPPPVKVWAEANNIPVWQPENFTDQEAVENKLADYNLLVVVAYNHILPQWLIELPQHGTLNVHPSLLPKYRGPSPIRSTILANDHEVGVSVMLLDEKMDHGPIVAQETEKIDPVDWPLDGCELDARLAKLGGVLLAKTVPAWVAGDITAIEQNHDLATYTQKFSKADGELNIDPLDLPTGDDAYNTLLKIRGLAGWPGTFFVHEGKRVKITAAHIENDTLIIERVVPEGKSEMPFTTYLQSLAN